jgi:hypothetical protein
MRGREHDPENHPPVPSTPPHQHGADFGPNLGRGDSGEVRGGYQQRRSIS